jgi:hypothetical protein
MHFGLSRILKLDRSPLSDARRTALVDPLRRGEMAKRSWSKEEINKLRELSIDPVQNDPEKLIRLIKHFLSGRSKFAVTEGSGPVKVSKGLATKVQNLCWDGKLNWLVEDSDLLDKATPRVMDGPKQDHDLAPNKAQTYIDVSVNTDYQHRYLGAGPRLNWLGPVTLKFHVINQGHEALRFPKLHVWFLNGKVFLDEQLTKSQDWKYEGTSNLPELWKRFSSGVAFERYSAGLFADAEHSLMPSRYPVLLPLLRILYSPFIGMIPIPWELEAHGWGSISGCLLCWRSRGGQFHSEEADLHIDFDELADKVNRFVYNN